MIADWDCVLARNRSLNPGSDSAFNSTRSSIPRGLFSVVDGRFGAAHEHGAIHQAVEHEGDLHVVTCECEGFTQYLDWSLHPGPRCTFGISNCPRLATRRLWLHIWRP